jgi:hypothetical protein
VDVGDYLKDYTAGAQFPDKSPLKQARIMSAASNINTKLCLNTFSTASQLEISNAKSKLGRPATANSLMDKFRPNSAINVRKRVVESLERNCLAVQATPNLLEFDGASKMTTEGQELTNHEIKSYARLHRIDCAESYLENYFFLEQDEDELRYKKQTRKPEQKQTATAR